MERARPARYSRAAGSLEGSTPGWKPISAEAIASDENRRGFFSTKRTSS
jgi:hypothetical protein